MRPQVITDTVTIAAGATVENAIAANDALAGQVRAEFAGQIQLYVTVSDSDVEFSFDAGQENFVDLSQARVRPAGLIQDPEDLITDDAYVPRGAQLILRVTNGNAASQTLTYRIIITPLDPTGADVPLPASKRITQRGPIDIGASTKNNQQFTGLKYERAIRPCLGTLYMSASAAGLTAQLFVGQDRVQPPSAVPPTNDFVREPYDMVIADIEIPADRQAQLSIDETSGAVLSTWWRWVLDENV